VLPAVSTVDRTDEREIERNHELDALVDSLRRAATESPTIMSFRIHRGSDSEVYLYGPDGAALRQAIEATVAGRPIGVGAVIDSIA